MSLIFYVDVLTEAASGRQRGIHLAGEVSTIGIGDIVRAPSQNSRKFPAWSLQAGQRLSCAAACIFEQALATTALAILDVRDDHTL